ncbi:MAG: Zn-dependent hydrolase, partial [Acidobacteriota bacterium]
MTFCKIAWTLTAAIWSLLPPQTQDAAQSLRVDSKRLQSRIEELAESAAAGSQGVNRLAFSQADVQGRSLVASWMRQAGLQVRTDPAGNLIGHRPGSQPGLPPILIGSHIDSVPQAGKYDGTVGVIAAIECAQLLEEHGIRTRHPLEVIVFTDEEGSMLGSRALAGDLSEGILQMATQSGKTVAQGLQEVGGDPQRLSEAVRGPQQVRAYLEMHIEQGGVLESEGADIGVVEGIVGIAWWDVTVEGFANHAGTTPMDRRSDALLAAARMIVAINQAVKSFPGRQVGTVGRIRAEP